MCNSAADSRLDFKHLDLKKVALWAAKMPQQLGAHTVPAEDLSSVPSSHLEQLITACNSCTGGWLPPTGRLLQLCTLTPTQAHTAYTLL